MKTFVLDYSKWRCGGNKGDNVLGKGPTAMKNGAGFMCCLGQMALQINPKLKLRGKGTPAETNEVIPLLTERDGSDTDDTPLSNTMMDINDDETTTPEEKIKLIREKLRTVSIKLIVINKPKK